MDMVAQDLPFVAPIPRGHEVSVVWLRRSPDAASEVALALDRTDRVLYADPSLSGPLGRDPRVLHDPIGVLTRFTWVVTRSITGVAAGAVVMTTSTGESNEAKTRLFVESHDTPR